ncbi:MAG: sulfotransferase [Burkholderiales bacterium]|nr:sulfotransferase [Burkholderiales bacterium]
MPTAEPGRNTLCPCGSGKKFKRCCGAAQAASPPANGGGLTQALALIQQGQLLQAETLLADLVKAQPRNPTYHYLSGYAALQGGRHAEAAVAMGKAIDLGLTDPAAFYHYGCTLAALGRYPEAANAFEQSLALKPDFLPARTNLASCRFELRDFAQAEQHYRQTLASDPSNLAACHNLGQVFYLTQRIGEAIEYFKRAAEAAPNVAEFRASLATMQEADNQLDAAESSARTALASEPYNVTAAVALARVLRRREQTTEALTALTAADLRTSMPRTAIAYWSERGQTLEVLGRYREAFDAYAQSKALLAETRTQRYDWQATEQALASERSILTPERVTAWALKPEPSTPAPLFIVGFPRSGTTLLEQMLGCHSLIVPCGELETAIERETSSSDYFDNLAKLNENDRQARLQALRMDYLAVLRSHAEHAPEARYASNKLPLNLMRIGIIRLLFPEARIIHVLRHPLDAVLSAYFTPFLFGNEWSLRLTDTAHLFSQSWRHAETMQRLPGTHFLRVRYEDLVTHPEPVLKEVLAFLDLPWEPACLDFHQSRRIARTASYAQVTRTLYQTSKKRYRHYLDYIDVETLALLQPVIAEAGYEVEYLNSLQIAPV